MSPSPILCARWLYFCIGFVPITTLALALLEVVPLHESGPVLVSGAISIGFFVAVVEPRVRVPVARGFLGGLVAVLIYDCTRLPFVILGGWPDFIPEIGVWLYNDPDTAWWVGYAWRFLGNGAGMGLAFLMTIPLLRWRVDRRLAGIIFGVAVWSGLLTVLLTAPDGQAKLFPLTPATFGLSLLGHLVYGSVLGLVAHSEEVSRVDCSVADGSYRLEFEHVGAGRAIN